MGLTRKGIVDQKPQFIPTLSLIIQNNSKVMFNTHVILFQYCLLRSSGGKHGDQTDFDITPF